MASNVTLDRIGANGEFGLISMYNNENDNKDGDSPFQFNSFNTDVLGDHISLFHLNCHLSYPTFSFDAIGISEIYQCNNDARLRLTGCHNNISQHREDGPRGGVGLFIKDNLMYTNRDDISVFIPHTFESVFY